MLRRRLAVLLFLSLITAPSPNSRGEGPAKALGPVPGPDLTPGQVIETQLLALQFNDKPSKNAGIATTFRFASPGNREATGPLARFTLIVQSPAFAPLINHRIAGYGPLVVKDGLALERVTIVAADGQAMEFEFHLSKDPASGCWFTDGVIPIPAKPAINPGKVA